MTLQSLQQFAWSVQNSQLFPSVFAHRLWKSFFCFFMLVRAVTSRLWKVSIRSPHQGGSKVAILSSSTFKVGSHQVSTLGTFKYSTYYTVGFCIYIHPVFVKQWILFYPYLRRCETKCAFLKPNISSTKRFESLQLYSATEMCHFLIGLFPGGRLALQSVLPVWHTQLLSYSTVTHTHNNPSISRALTGHLPKGHGGQHLSKNSPCASGKPSYQKSS